MQQTMPPSASPPPPGAPSTPPPTSGMAIAGFVLAFLGGVLGIVFSAIALAQIGKSNGRLRGKGLAIAGLVISIVVSLFAVLAAISIPAFLGYMHKAKASEAHLQLRRMASAASAYAAINQALPDGTAALTPDTPCCNQPGRQCAPSGADWRTPAWELLEFEGPFDSSRFRYSYQSTADRFVGTAVGDLDCDGNEVSYTITVDLVGGTPVMSDVMTSGRD